MNNIYLIEYIYIDDNIIVFRKDKFINYLLLSLILLIITILIFMRYFLLHGDYVNITIFVLLGHLTNYILSILINKN